MGKFNKNGYKYILILILYLFTWFDYAFSYEYCNKNYTGRICDIGNPHMVCGGAKTYLYAQDAVTLEASYFGGFFPTNAKFRKIFIDTHDEIRNLFASGEVVSTKNNVHYPKAARMRVFKWDTELEYLARWNVEHALAMIHDRCHGTNRFPRSGQNLASYAGGVVSHVDFWNQVNETLWGMFDEKDRLEKVAEYPEKLVEEWHAKAGHFNQLVQDRQGLLGCAAGVGLNCCACEPKDRTSGAPVTIQALFSTCYYWACNYEATNEKDYYVYKRSEGAPGNNCTANWNTKNSKRWPNLCENPGKIFPQFAPGEYPYYDARFVPPELLGIGVTVWY